MDGQVGGFLWDGCRVVLYWVVFRVVFFRVVSCIASGVAGIAERWRHEGGRHRIEGYSEECRKARGRAICHKRPP